MSESSETRRTGFENHSELRAALDGWRQPRILVLGDLILDRYSWGDVPRISPEAPVPVLRHERDELRLGGAAAVAGLLSALGADVRCGGVLGQDPAADSLLERLQVDGIGWIGVVDPDRPTTVKQRFLSARHGHAQLLRVDFESDARLSPPHDEALWQSVCRELPDCDAVVVSDYDKGVCTRGLVRRLMAAAVEQQIPVLVDPPRRADWSDYAGATALVPNRVELALARGTPLPNAKALLQSSGDLCRRFAVETLVVKLDAEGMALLRPDQPAISFSTPPRTVFDVTGAGDTVIAVLAMARSAGQSWETACRLANLAGGLQVERAGVSRIDRDDLRRALAPPRPQDPGCRNCLTLDEAARRSAEARSRGQRVVFTNGCFAALHAGHVAYLQEARALGDLLIVGVNSTASIRRLKGDRPIIEDGLRLNLLAAIPGVDGVVLFDDDTPHRLLEAIRPDLLVKGGTTDVIVGRELVESWGGEVRRLAAIPGLSTTQLLAQSAWPPVERERLPARTDRADRPRNVTRLEWVAVTDGPGD